MIILCDGPQAPQGRGIQFLPIIAIGATPGPQPVEPAAVESPEEAFYRLLVNDPRQQRAGLTWCGSLSAAARWKALDIVQHGYWAHRASNGAFANTTARIHGCHLPHDYDGNWNGCESLAAGSPDALPVFNSLSKSRHAEHLFGLNDFFRRQTHCGIAMVAGGVNSFVWCILIGVCL